MPLAFERVHRQLPRLLGAERRAANLRLPNLPEQPERNAETCHTQVVEWLERNRFEAHPKNSAPYDALLGRLGADHLALLGRDWRAEGRQRGPKSGCLCSPRPATTFATRTTTTRRQPTGASRATG
jgi:hypothetical protein